MVGQHAGSANPDKILAQLRDRLRVLYRHNGEPSTREIARRTAKAISHTTANVVLRCEKIPRWGQLELVVEALGGDTGEFRQLWIAVRNAADQAETTVTGLSVGHVDREVNLSESVSTEVVTDVDSSRPEAPEMPWTSDALQQRLRRAEEILAQRVIGQPNAISRVVDLLIRSVVGLDGVDIRGHKRPRLVLFFAGPVGVGKIELTKALAELLFEDSDSSHVRFRMSEFSSEDASDRLFGASPGYVGNETGSELANCIRRQSFRVVVFDEIEKAHPRILDKMLLMIEDGELVDHHGSVSFEDAVVVFTTSVGTSSPGETGRQVQHILPGSSYPEIEYQYREFIASFFRDYIGRPELYYRLEQGLVVFDFIRPSNGANAIVDGIVKDISDKLQREFGLTLEFAECVADHLRQLATEDLSRGGRGIGSRIETVLLNPLARELFERPRKPGQRLRVLRIHQVGQSWRLEIE